MEAPPLSILLYLVIPSIALVVLLVHAVLSWRRLGAFLRGACRVLLSRSTAAEDVAIREYRVDLATKVLPELTGSIVLLIVPISLVRLWIAWAEWPDLGEEALARYAPQGPGGEARARTIATQLPLLVFFLAYLLCVATSAGLLRVGSKRLDLALTLLLLCLGFECRAQEMSLYGRGLSILLAFGYCHHALSVFGYILGVWFYLYDVATDDSLRMLEELQFAAFLWLLYYGLNRVTRAHGAGWAERQILAAQRLQVDCLVDATFDAVLRLDRDLLITDENPKLRNMLMLEASSSDETQVQPVAFMDFVMEEDRSRLTNFLVPPAEEEPAFDSFGVATTIEVSIRTTDGTIIRAQIFHVAGSKLANDLLGIQELDRAQSVHGDGNSEGGHRLPLAMLSSVGRLVDIEERSQLSSVGSSASSRAGGVPHVVTVASVELEVDAMLDSMQSVRIVFHDPADENGGDSGEAAQVAAESPTSQIIPALPKLKSCMNRPTWRKFQPWFMESFNKLYHEEDEPCEELTSLVIDLPKVDVVVHAEQVEMQMIEDSDQPKLVLSQVSMFPMQRRNIKPCKIRRNVGTARIPSMTPVLSPVTEMSSGSINTGENSSKDAFSITKKSSSDSHRQQSTPTSKASSGHKLLGGGSAASGGGDQEGSGSVRSGRSSL
eukprot:TRINITY_DN13327_c0_g1_i1.p1 TRINITY_DN13327_c0_g1~~TRINITY_DN13327_c0_g1_i1.p1  ORF type:complete len:662 (-),score=122.83 TRINITY_DN13327_c0_g1_i1:315-2300(-)